MGSRDVFGKQPKRFVTDEQFRRKMASQQAADAEVPDVLAKRAGVSPERELKLEYFFYTNRGAKAADLAADLAPRVPGRASPIGFGQEPVRHHRLDRADGHVDRRGGHMEPADL